MSLGRNVQYPSVPFDYIALKEHMQVSLIKQVQYPTYLIFLGACTAVTEIGVTSPGDPKKSGSARIMDLIRYSHLYLQLNLIRNWDIVH